MENFSAVLIFRAIFLLSHTVSQILTIFSKRRDLDIFKKKALYIYIREMTDCETPHLTKVVNKLKDEFYKLYDSYISAGLIRTKVL